MPILYALKMNIKMTKPFSLFFLASTLFFSSCGCGNSDGGNGPRQEEIKKEEEKKEEIKKEEPKFSLELAEGVKKEDLNTNQPIPLVLKGENFLKEGAKFQISIHEEWETKGTLHFMDNQGKAGEWIKREGCGSKKEREKVDEVELKDGVLPLIFVPNGKSGKTVISLLVGGDGFQINDISIELDLKSMISLKVPAKVGTSKPIKASLKIDSEEEYTLKQVKHGYYPLELTYDKGGKKSQFVLETSLEQESMVST